MSNHTIVGVIYLISGLFGVAENGLTAALIATGKEMRNPTYIYMINLCLCDAVTLIAIGVYSGIVLLFPDSMRPASTRIFAYLTAFSWYGACQFIVLMSFSRYVQLKSAHKMHEYFKRRNLILTIILSWSIPVTAFSWLVYYPATPFAFFLEQCSWQFDESQYLGKILEYFFMVLIALIALIVTFFNIKTLMHVHRMRMQVHFIKTSSNAVREIKLFAQCAITSTFFTVAAVTYFVVNAFLKDRMSTEAFVVAHCMWILNAVQYPMIYFSLNKLLRERFCVVFLGKKSSADMRKESYEKRVIKKKETGRKLGRKKSESPKLQNIVNGNTTRF